MCDLSKGEGFAVVVDQGYLNLGLAPPREEESAWTGPQILAHHLLLMLTSDLKGESKHCPRRESLLHPSLYPGKQRIDACVVEKLKKSGVSNRDCMLD